MTLEIKKPRDTSIFGSIGYLKENLNYLGGIGYYSVGLFLTDLGFKEPGYKAGSGDAYKNGRAMDLESKLRELVNIRIERLKGQLQMAEERVKKLKLKERSTIPNLGTVIIDILKDYKINSENFDKKAKDVLERLGKTSYLICMESSHFRRSYSPAQYRDLVNYIPKRMRSLKEEKEEDKN